MPARQKQEACVADLLRTTRQTSGIAGQGSNWYQPDDVFGRLRPHR
jgi:hypothetical protein